ncbi:MAG: sugar ABC transporter permease [Anaerolineaceae bacterium]|nr:sugar ABC transporter permease [Anaerolineaceae bacterium]MDD4042428.1 sugar ABC transporter permease [Anaerolineaceae bacterium]MDD4578570.1 sugar ABC transporter permease [Anaerolineaceae bacterium]
MENKQTDSVQQGTIPAVIAFVGVVLVIFVIALLNAPTMGGARVMASPQTFFAEVKATAIPYMLVATGIAVVAGFFIAREVKKVWPHKRKREQFLTGYAFLAPYIIVTLTFTIGVIMFALYISFTKYDIFSRPEWIGLANYKEAFAGFTDSTKRDFLQSLYNVLWYAAIVVPIQTYLALQMARLLNAPIKFKQFFRTVFYAPSVTSSVVITLIFIWLYLKNGYLNFFLQSVLGWVGINWEPIAWLSDPRGLFQLILEPFGVNIPSTQWYFRGPSIAWMAIMFQNIFTTVPTFMIMYLAALQDINPALYEAASIEGASKRQVFRQITRPLLKPITMMIVVLGTIGTLQIFDQVYLATAGGPLKTSLTPVYLIFTEALGVNGPITMGYASALAFILAAIIFGLTFVQRRILTKGTEMY